uniref:Similar to probable ethanolamine kinase n=1 Tax=Lupinus angustifolius TaxID=3871 RepID=A0A0D6DQG9_LUPAN|nr:similar to probable ethanolamine kinase [Lupinus angustifolius]
MAKIEDSTVFLGRCKWMNGPCYNGGYGETVMVVTMVGVMFTELFVGGLPTGTDPDIPAFEDIEPIQTTIELLPEIFEPVTNQEKILEPETETKTGLAVMLEANNMGKKIEVEEENSDVSVGHHIQNLGEINGRRETTEKAVIWNHGHFGFQSSLAPHLEDKVNVSGGVLLGTGHVRKVYKRKIRMGVIRESKIAAKIAMELKRFHHVEIPGSKEPQLWNDIWKFFEKSVLEFDDSEMQKTYETISFTEIRDGIVQLKWKKLLYVRLNGKALVRYWQDEFTLGNFGSKTVNHIIQRQSSSSWSDEERKKK